MSIAYENANLLGEYDNGSVGGTPDPLAVNTFTTVVIWLPVEAQMRFPSASTETASWVTSRRR